MRSKIIVLLFALIAAIAFFVDQRTQKDNDTLSIYMFDTNGRRTGVVWMQPTSNGQLLVTANIWGLTPGFHGFHIHETGRCNGNFTSANGHFDLHNANHGEHSGDLPVLQADERGKAFLAVHTARFEIEDLFDADGSALIIHAGTDNFANVQPRYGGADATTLANGDAGGRIACGVIAAPEDN